MARNPLTESITTVLRPAGFERDGSTWRRRNPETIEVVHLQRSRFGGQHYVNYALWLVAIAPAEKPKEEHCHVRIRLDEVTDDRDAVAKIFDLEAEVPDRAARIEVTMRSAFLPFAERCRTLSGLRAEYERGGFRRAMVHVVAKRLLAGDSNSR